MKKIIKWVGIGFAIIIVIGMLSGSGNSSPKKVDDTDNAQTADVKTEDSSQAVFKIGDAVELDGKTITVNEVKPYSSKNQFLTPKSGNKFVAIDVTLKNNSEDAYNYNVLEFSLQDNEDYSYTNAVSDIEPYLTVGAIQPGQTTRGFIAYEIPETNEPVKLIYTPNFWGTKQIIVELK